MTLNTPTWLEGQGWALMVVLNGGAEDMKDKHEAPTPPLLHPLVPIHIGIG
jgi:hypothetical protein